jgi:hypothetical protein
MTLITRSLAAVVAIVAGVAAVAQTLPIENIQLRGDRFAGCTTARWAMSARCASSTARARLTNTTGAARFNTLLRTPEVGERSPARQRDSATRLDCRRRARAGYADGGPRVDLDVPVRTALRVEGSTGPSSTRSRRTACLI